MNQNQFLEKLISLLACKESVQLAAVCRAALENDAESGPNGYLVKETSEAGVAIGRLVGKATAGVDELYERLIDAPRGGQILECRLEVEGDHYLIFADPELKHLYGILMVTAERWPWGGESRFDYIQRPLNMSWYGDALLRVLAGADEMPYLAEVRAAVKPGELDWVPPFGPYPARLVKYLNEEIHEAALAGTHGHTELMASIDALPDEAEVLDATFRTAEYEFEVYTDGEVTEILGIVAVEQAALEAEIEARTERARGRDAATTGLSDPVPHELEVLLSDGSVGVARLTTYTRYARQDQDGAYIQELEIEGVGDFRAEADDHFTAMTSLRLELEPKGIKLLCFGARRDVWSTFMQRDMGSGDVATLISYPRDDIMVERSIFEPAPADKVGTVREQADFAMEWMERRAEAGRAYAELPVGFRLTHSGFMTAFELAIKEDDSERARNILARVCVDGEEVEREMEKVKRKKAKVLSEPGAIATGFRRPKPVSRKDAKTAKGKVKRKKAKGEKR